MKAFAVFSGNTSTPREFRQAPDRLRWEVYFAFWNWNYTLCISRQPVCDGRARRGDTTLKERAI